MTFTPVRNNNDNTYTWSCLQVAFKKGIQNLLLNCIGASCCFLICYGILLFNVGVSHVKVMCWTLVFNMYITMCNEIWTLLSGYFEHTGWIFNLTGLLFVFVLLRY